MAIFKQIGKGFINHGKAIEFIFKHNLWYYLFFPAMLGLALLFFGFFGVQYASRSLTDYILSTCSLAELNSEILSVLIGVLTFFISLIIKFILGMILYSYLKYLVLIFCSPVLARLSEKTEAIVTGVSTRFSIHQFLKDISRGILVVFRNFIIETGLFILSLLLLWIPILKWFILPVQWSFNWYFIGYSLFDYCYERRGWSIAKGTEFTRKNKSIAITHGFVFSQIMKVPFVGICVAPVLGIVSATLLFLEQEKHITS
jgi:CysZ protein